MIKSIINWLKIKLLLNKKGDIQSTSLLFIGALVVGGILLIIILYYIFAPNSQIQSLIKNFFN